MKKVAIDARYFTGRYWGSGFHSYLQNLLLAWPAAVSKNKPQFQLHLFSPLPVAKLLPLLRLRKKKNPLFLVHEVKRKSEDENFLDALLSHPCFKALAPDLLFLPQVVFPHREKIPTELKVVMTVHDLIPTLFLTPAFLLRGRTPWKLITLKGAADHFRLKTLLPRLSQLIAISNTTKKSLLQLYPKAKLEKKISVIPLGGDATTLTRGPKRGPKAVPLLKQHGIKPRQYLFYFGGHTVRKNVGRFSKAFWRWKKRQTTLPQRDFKLVMVGSGYWKEWLERRPLLRQEVVFLPKVSEAVLAQLIHGAWATVYPSLYEGFGLPLLESWQLNCPVLFSKTPALLEILSQLGAGGADQAALLRYGFNPYREKEMERAIEEVMRSRSGFLELLSRAAKERQSGIAAAQPSPSSGWIGWPFSWEKNALATAKTFAAAL